MQPIAVFFDRDNTLNIDSGYLGAPEKVQLFEGVVEGITILKKELNVKIIVISNQSGIGRGLITHEQVQLVNNKINELLETEVDRFYYCPFHPDFNQPEKADCLKPSPKLVFQAAEEFNRSYFVGDMPSDIECGINAGIKTILINYKNNSDKIISLKKRNKTPNFITDNYLNVCDFIIDNFRGGNQFAN